MEKPFSPACERNQAAILDVLRQHLPATAQVLEIGSGTGQHAVHFARALPGVTWQTSDVAAHLDGIRLWLAEAALPNTPPPLTFDIDAAPPRDRFDVVYSANTLHIMGWPQVQRFFALLPGLMRDGALLVVYGPFNIGGRYTSDGNAAFDAALKADHPSRGLRDLEAVDALAHGAGLSLIANHPMPANNRTLVWRHATGAAR